ncbi:MAG: FIG00450775: hypothetical protein, partial [uncultured Microvirga sp.]
DPDHALPDPRASLAARPPARARGRRRAADPLRARPRGDDSSQARGRRRLADRALPHSPGLLPRRPPAAAPHAPAAAPDPPKRWVVRRPGPPGLQPAGPPALRRKPRNALARGPALRRRSRHRLEPRADRQGPRQRDFPAPAAGEFRADRGLRR